MTIIANSKEQSATVPVPNSLVQQIQDDKVLFNVFQNAEKAFFEHRRILERNAKNLIERTLKEFSLETNVDVYFLFNINRNTTGLLTDPHFYIPLLAEGKRYCGQGQSFWVNISGNWINTKKMPSNNQVCVNDLDLQKKLKSINLEHLAEACATLTEKTGCRVEHAQYDIVKANKEKIPRNEENLVALHSDSKIVLSGKKDNDDKYPWAIVQTRKAHLVIYYSTNGYGFGYDKCVFPDKTTSDFYFWLANGDRNKLMSIIPANIMKRLNARGC